MKLAFSTLGCTDWSLEEIVTNAIKYNMGGVELRGRDRQHISTEFSKGERKEVKALFNGNGIEIACLAGYSNFSQPDSEVRGRNEDILLANVELAADIQCKYVRTFIGDLPEGVQHSDACDYAAESLTKVGKQIEGSGVKVLIETHGRGFSTGKDLKPLMERIESKSIGILWDMPHSFRSGESLEDTYKLLGDYIFHTHIKDEYVDKEGKIIHCIPGEGTMPLQQCKNLLLSNGFAGYICLEWERHWNSYMPELVKALPAFSKLMQE